MLTVEERLHFLENAMTELVTARWWQFILIVALVIAFTWLANWQVNLERRIRRVEEATKPPPEDFYTGTGGRLV